MAIEGKRADALVIAQGFSKEGLKLQKAFYVLKKDGSADITSLDGAIEKYLEVHAPSVRVVLEVAITKGD